MPVLALTAVLTHAEAADFARGVRQALLARPEGLVVDASVLQEFDSSALAVLLECRREALDAGKTFSVTALPSRLRQLAGLYGVAELLPATGT